jgi:hypothetical protein
MGGSVTVNRRGYERVIWAVGSGRELFEERLDCAKDPVAFGAVSAGG